MNTLRLHEQNRYRRDEQHRWKRTRSLDTRLDMRLYVRIPMHISRGRTE